MQEEHFLTSNSVYSSELSFEECLKVLNLPESYSAEDLTRQFSTLSKRFHPDVNSNYRTQYIKISKSYDQLKNALHKTGSPKKVDDMQKIEKPRVIVHKPVLDVKNILQYTVTLNWLDIFTAWNLEGKYEKEIRYGYHKTCSCEELCVECRGVGISFSTYCAVCKGKGWVHYCSDCGGQGKYLKKEIYTLSLPYGIYIPKQIYVESKGNQTGHLTRGPLLLNIRFLDNVKEIKPGVFVNTVYISPDALTKPYLEFVLSKDQSLYINTREITQIPYKKDLNKSFKLEYENRRIKLFLYLKLKLN